MIVHRQQQYKDVDDLEGLNRSFKQIILDHKQALDWIETQPNIDQTRLGLFGISAGAVKGSLTFAIDDRIDATVLALVGGDLPYVLAYSNEKAIRRKRNGILKQHNVSADELYSMLSDQFRYDPLAYARYADARNMLLILGAFDSVGPFKKGLELRRAPGRPEPIVIPTGHMTSIVYLPWLQVAATSFFKRKLGG